MLIAELFQNEVWKKYEADELPPLPFPSGAVDISGVTPEPQVGDIYDPVSDAFSAPDPVGVIVELGRVVITSITGAGVNSDKTQINAEEPTLATTALNLPVTVVASVPHPLPSPPEESWVTPVQGPKNEMFANTHRPQGSTEVEITFTPTESGLFLLTEQHINKDLSGARYDFAGLSVRVTMETT